MFALKSNKENAPAIYVTRDEARALIESGPVKYTPSSSLKPMAKDQQPLTPFLYHNPYLVRVVDAING
jgi:hypothetical protein